MIYGYHCVHPEQADEIDTVKRCKERTKLLEELNAPDVIIEEDRRIYRNRKAQFTSVSFFRERIKKLYEEGKEKCILVNYRAVFKDVGFDPLIAYSGSIHGFSINGDDYFKPLDSMTDDDVVIFLAYVQKKFDEYLEKYTPKLNEDRELFMNKMEAFVERRVFPPLALDNFDCLRQTIIEIDDGFTTTIKDSRGWYSRQKNMIMLSAASYCDNNTQMLFHECLHAIAGISNDAPGFYRLSKFFGKEHEDIYKIINEAYVNLYSITLFSNDPPERMQYEHDRDFMLFLAAQILGKKIVDKRLFDNAYFSNDISHVKKLADEMKQQHDTDKLFSILQKRQQMFEEKGFLLVAREV